MSDPPRHPLKPMDPELREKLKAEYSLGDDLQPLTDNPLEREAQLKANQLPEIALTKAEREKALQEALTAGMEKKMEEPKSGIKTSEFWLKLLAGAAIVALAFTIDHGLPAIAEKLPGLGIVGTVLLVLVPVAKMGLGWVLERLSSKYADNRTEVKVAAASARAA